VRKGGKKYFAMFRVFKKDTSRMELMFVNSDNFRKPEIHEHEPTMAAVYFKFCRPRLSGNFFLIFSHSAQLSMKQGRGGGLYIILIAYF